MRQSQITARRTWIGIFARSWYAGAGRTAEELDRPLVAVANSWNEIAPENVHLRSVADAVKAGVRAAGGTPMEFGAIHTTDVIAMASEGMRYVLPSRELVADCIEVMIQAHAFDAVVLIAGGDKVTPGMIMGALRTGVPTVYVYAGTTEVGWYRGRAVSWETVFEAIRRTPTRRHRRHRRGGTGCRPDARARRRGQRLHGQQHGDGSRGAGAGGSQFLDGGGRVERDSYGLRGRPVPGASRLSMPAAGSVRW